MAHSNNVLLSQVHTKIYETDVLSHQEFKTLQIDIEYLNVSPNIC